MANKVRWKESINELEINNEKNLIEIGPGKVLSGLVKRITSSFKITSINCGVWCYYSIYFCVFYYLNNVI